MSALAGATAGIMGLTSLLGFVFYFVSAFVLSVSLFDDKSKKQLYLLVVMGRNVLYKAYGYHY